MSTPYVNSFRPGTPHVPEEVLDRFLIGDLTVPEADEVQAHLAQCSECAHALSQNAALVAALYAYPKERWPAPSLLERVQLAWKGLMDAPSRARGAILAPGMVLAAAALLRLIQPGAFLYSPRLLIASGAMLGAEHSQTVPFGDITISTPKPVQAPSGPLSAQLWIVDSKDREVFREDWTTDSTQVKRTVHVTPEQTSPGAHRVMLRICAPTFGWVIPHYSPCQQFQENITLVQDDRSQP